MSRNESVHYEKIKYYNTKVTNSRCPQIFEKNLGATLKIQGPESLKYSKLPSIQGATAYNLVARAPGRPGFVHSCF